MVNGTSGGNASKQLLDLGLTHFTFQHDHAECTVWVFNLRDGDNRKSGFSKIVEKASVPHQVKEGNVRVIACGGDGTVKWVISELVKLKRTDIPIGVIPFGTGNDFARAFNWGSTAPNPLIGNKLQALKQKVISFLNSEIVSMDCWRCSIYLKDIEDASFKEVKDAKVIQTHEGAKEMHHEMLNYFSVGFDAQIMFEFEQQRTKSQLGNKIVMARKGVGQTIVRPPKLKESIDIVMADGNECKARLNDRLLLFSNIPSYSAGANPWRRSKDDDNMLGNKDGFHPQFVGDSVLECLTIHSSANIGLNITTGGSIKGGIQRTAQAKEYNVHFKDMSSIFLQVDGEAMQVDHADHITIRHGYQIQVLRNDSAIAISFPDGHVLATKSMGEEVFATESRQASDIDMDEEENDDIEEVVIDEIKSIPEPEFSQRNLDISEDVALVEQ